MSLFPETTPLAMTVLWLRFVGVFLLAFSLAGIYLSARELFPTMPRLALAVLALAALWPSHLAASAAVNNDALVEVFTVWTLYFAIRLLRHGPDLTTISWLLALSLLAMSSKRTGLASLGIAALALALWGVGYLARTAAWAITTAGFRHPPCFRSSGRDSRIRRHFLRAVGHPQRFHGQTSRPASTGKVWRKRPTPRLAAHYCAHSSAGLAGCASACPTLCCARAASCSSSVCWA